MKTMVVVGVKWYTKKRIGIYCDMENLVSLFLSITAPSSVL